MNIVINAILYHEKPRGVGRYLNNLILELSKIDKTNNYYIYYGEWMKEYSFLDVEQENFKFIETKIPRNTIIRNIYQGFIFPFLIKKHEVDVLHVPDTSPVFFTTCKTVSTIHDLAEFYVSEKYSKIQYLMRKIIVKGQAKKSDYILTVSQYSKNDIINRFDINANKITVTYNGVDKKILNKNSNLNELPKGIKKNRYLLYVGEIEKSKNVGIIIEAFNLLTNNIKDELSVVIAGRKGNDYSNLIELVNKYNLNDKIKILDYVSDEELNSLYKNCNAFIFPSLFEGFGLPIIEAMASKVPVISSNSTCLPEVAGDAALLFNPNNNEELKIAIEKIILNENISNKLIEKGINRVKYFDWNKTARKTLEVYSKLYAID